jgi:diguanylate cyclase (GGDEF)-like protein/PAS domain S-box-containing protein
MTVIGRAHRWPFVALTILVLTLLLAAAGYLAPFERSVADTRSRVLQREVASDIVVVGIDARSLADLRQWPWPRRYHARLLELIAAAEPRRVFVDVDFSAHTGAEDDALLESALQQFEPSQIVLPAFFQPDEGVAGKMVYTRPLERFGRHVTLGGVNFRPDQDGLIRSMAATWAFGGTTVPSAVAVIAGSDAATGEAPIDYSISPASFTYVSYVDLLAGRIDPTALYDKTVLIGPTALELTDIKAVPVYQALPGVVVQALAAQSLREGALRTTPRWIDLLALALLTALAAAFFVRNGWRKNLLIGTAAIALLGALNVYAYSAHRMVLELVPALLVLGGLFLAATIRSLDQETMRSLAYALGIRRRDALLGSVAESSADAIMVVGPGGQIEMANAAAASMFACSREAMVGALASRYVPLPDAAIIPATLPGKVIEQDATRFDGTAFPVEITVSPVDVQGEALRTVIVRDITARKLQEQRLQYEATHDSLTDLPNRAALMNHLEVVLTRTPADGRVALLMLDLCRFKEVNDTLGHEVGDQVLREVARRFESVADGGGFVARLGGDEFTLVLEQTAPDDDIVEIASILHESLREPIPAAGIAIDVGVSIGIARYPDEAKDPATLLRHADVAMYVAKRRQTRFEMYDPANDRNTVRRLAMVGELRGAIANGQLRLYYQPKINFRTGQCDSVEALMRWPHPEYGFVSPAEFIVLAESTDLIRPLTEWTLACAMAQWVNWRASGLQVRIAVNLSARLLQDTDFVSVLRGLLERHRVPGEALELEITESAMLYDSERALRVIRDIHSLGIALSIDDFGTGFSSLAYLRELPVHAVKLDKSFVTHLHERADDRSIVNGTVRMAHELGLKVVAEGVESEWAAQYLADAGYDYGQGYRYSPAVPAEECRRWIVSFNSAASADQDQQLAASG